MLLIKQRWEVRILNTQTIIAYQKWLQGIFTQHMLRLKGSKKIMLKQLCESWRQRQVLSCVAVGVWCSNTATLMPLRFFCCHFSWVYSVLCESKSLTKENFNSDQFSEFIFFLSSIFLQLGTFIFKPWFRLLLHFSFHKFKLLGNFLLIII